MHLAAQHGANVDVLRLLYKTHPGLVKEVDDMGRTPLHCLCQCPLRATIETLKEFVKFDASLLHVPITLKRTHKYLNQGYNSRTALLGPPSSSTGPFWKTNENYETSVRAHVLSLIWRFGIRPKGFSLGALSVIQFRCSILHMQ